MRPQDDLDAELVLQCYLQGLVVNRALRRLHNDAGEMRRVLNAFLQFIEQDTSDSIIVAATNSPKLLDRALYRRFDDVLFYAVPDDEERRRLIQNVRGTYLPPKLPWRAAVAASRELSHAEITQACLDAVKQAILRDEARTSILALRLI